MVLPLLKKPASYFKTWSRFTLSMNPIFSRIVDFF